MHSVCCYPFRLYKSYPPSGLIQNLCDILKFTDFDLVDYLVTFIYPEISLKRNRIAWHKKGCNFLFNQMPGDVGPLFFHENVIHPAYTEFLKGNMAIDKHIK